MSLLMYLKNILVENVGPIDFIDFELQFNDNGDPKPLVLVGGNGSGKSIFLSIIVNFLVTSKRQLYEDVEIEPGKVYKLRSPLYIQNGKHFYMTKLLFEHGFENVEWQLIRSRKDFEEILGFTHLDPSWQKIQETENSSYHSNTQSRMYDFKKLMDKNICLYFPANRFEEPAWLNLRHMTTQAEWTDLEHMSSISNRRIVQYSPLKANQNWLLDILFDRLAFEGIYKIEGHTVAGDKVDYVRHFYGYKGSANNIFQMVQQIVLLCLQAKGNIELGYGNRWQRQVSVIKDGKIVIPNLFQLSTGQSSLLDIFTTIVRDYDLTRKEFTALSDIKGIVLVDEIDLHLHSSFQYEALPSLIKMFPKVQFIFTSHSPLFILGMERTFTKDGFVVVEMPHGRQIGTEGLMEFENAYNYFRETDSYSNDIREAIAESNKPLLFVEGDYDTRYLNKAAREHGYADLLNQINIKDCDGYTNLDKVWKMRNSPLMGALSQKVMLLYDCDINKSNDVHGKITRRVIETQENTPIKRGIENLFPEATINKAIGYKKAFIDITEATTKTLRGEPTIEPKKQEVNKDEKGNLCDWLCETGDADDFQNFSQIFVDLEAWLNSDTD